MPSTKRQFSRGRRTWGMDARTGERTLLRNLVRDGQTGLPVTRRSYEPRHPQESPIEVFDPIKVRSPAPNLDRVGYIVSWPTGPLDDLGANPYPYLALNVELANVTPIVGESPDQNLVFDPFVYDDVVYE